MDALIFDHVLLLAPPPQIRNASHLPPDSLTVVMTCRNA